MDVQERCGLCCKKKRILEYVTVTYIGGGEARRYEIPKLLCPTCKRWVKKMPEFFLKVTFDGLIPILLKPVSKKENNHDA